MRYKVEGLEIRSENAAKPPRQAVQWIVNWIRDLDPSTNTLDYGCGKMRYSVHFLERCKHVHLVDSKIQLNRRQLVLGKLCSIAAEIPERFGNCSVHEAESQSWINLGVDLVFCSNVLSTIPHEDTRLDVLDGMTRTLRGDGRLFLCTQYTNSYYSELERSNRAVKYEDGLLVISGSFASFYARIKKGQLEDYVRRVGLEVDSAFNKGQSAVVIARKG